MGLPSHTVRLARPNSAGAYVRHRPETTLLYQIVREYWPEFQTELTSHGRYLPAYVTKEFDEYLKCGRLEYGFLRVRCESCHDEKLVAFSCKKRGFRLKAPLGEDPIVVTRGLPQRIPSTWHYPREFASN